MVPKSAPEAFHSMADFGTTTLAAAIPTTAGTGLKVPSLVQFGKLATLDRSVIAGKIGAAPADWLHAHRAVFFGVFGFGQPSTA
jgi:mRNA interferase MazF